MQVMGHVDTQLPSQEDTVVLVQDHQVSGVVLQPQPLEYLELSNVLVVEEVSGNNNAKTKTKQNDDEHSDSSGLRGLLRISVSHSSLGVKSKMSKTVDSTEIRPVIPLFWTLWKLDWTWKCVSVGSWH